MDDVHTRFILNLPDDELRSAPRIFFQLEQAWWFYDDFICDGAAAAAAATDAATASTTAAEELPRYIHVKPFSYAMFQFSPLLQPMLPLFDTMYTEFANYKKSISTYGTILLNEEATQVALVRPWKSKSWTFPGGKVNQNESEYDAACRETYEETGFDPLVEPSVQFTSSSSSSPSSLREQSKLSYTERETNKKRTCYICRGVPTNFPFEPVARKEVSEIKWFDISTLPKQKTYAVLPFYNQLREWIKLDNKARRGSGVVGEEDADDDDDDDGGLAPFFSDDGKAPWEQDEDEGGGVVVTATTDKKNSSGNSVGSNNGPSSKKGQPQKHENKKRDGSRGKPKAQNNCRSTPPRAGSTASSRGGSTGRGGRRRGGSGEEASSTVVSASDPLVKSALAAPGESGRWTEDEMFAANEKLSGRKISYNGNPHEFAAGGWGSGIVRSATNDDGGETDDQEGGGRAAIVDPHAFHIVGGSFMNSEASATAASSLLAPPPDSSKLQPLVCARSMTPGSCEVGSSGGGDLELTPFFSDDGRAPWEDTSAVVGGANICASKDLTPPLVTVQGPPSGWKNSKGLALLNRLRQGECANNKERGGGEVDGEEPLHVAMMVEVKDVTDIDDWFMTDREITAKSQIKKLSMSRKPNPEVVVVPSHASPAQAASSPHGLREGTEGASPHIIRPSEHLVWMKHWALQLPQAGSTKLFGDFRLDVDSILNAASPVAHKRSN